MSGFQSVLRLVEEAYLHHLRISATMATLTCAGWMLRGSSNLPRGVAASSPRLNTLLTRDPTPSKISTSAVRRRSGSSITAPIGGPQICPHKPWISPNFVRVDFPKSIPNQLWFERDRRRRTHSAHGGLTWGPWRVYRTGNALSHLWPSLPSA